MDEVEFERQQAQAAARGKKAPKNLSVNTSVDKYQPQQQYEQQVSQAAAKGTGDNVHKEELKAKEEAARNDKKTAAKNYIKEYIASSSCQEALQIFQKVWHQVDASSKQGWGSAIVNTVKNLGAALTGSPDRQVVNENDVLAKMRADPGESVRITRAGDTLSDLLEYAKRFNISWEDITDIAYEVSNGKMDIRGSKEGLISSMKKDTSVNLNEKKTENLLYKGKGDLQYSSMNPKMAVSSVDMKSLANDIVTYNNRAEELTKMLESLEQATNVSAANLLKGVKTPGGLYVNNQGNRVNFNEDQNKRINQLLGDIQTLKTEQEAIANIVDNIPNGSQTDYEFVKAYRAAVEKDHLVDKGKIIPQLDKILMHHPSQQAGGELYTKARSNAGYN